MDNTYFPGIKVKNIEPFYTAERQLVPRYATGFVQEVNKEKKTLLIFFWIEQFPYSVEVERPIVSVMHEENAGIVL